MHLARIRARASVVIATIAVTFTLMAQVAVATPPTDTSGGFVSVQTVTNTRAADGNTFLTTRDSQVVTGTYSGTTTGESHITLHADGSGNVHGEFVCVCTIAGVGSGTVEFKYEGIIREGIFEGQYRVVGSSGGLAGTHGVGRFRAVGPVGTYSGSHHSNP
jgi:hypothetical protein